MARPVKPIDEELVQKLAERHWTSRQIAAFFDVSHDTIERRFAPILEKSRHRANAKLLDLLWERAGESDRILLHLTDRFLGALPTRTVCDLSNEDFIKEAERRLEVE